MKKLLLVLLFNFPNISLAKHANVFSTLDSLVVIFDENETELLPYTSYSHLNNDEIHDVYPAFGISDNHRLNLIDEFFADSKTLYFISIHRSNDFFEWFAKYRNAKNDYLVVGNS